MVPALRKDGYMLPCIALTKAIPDLTNGIQIIAFINQHEEKTEEEDVNYEFSYMLYRTDSEIIMGVSKSCYTKYGIHNSLVYGNPNNSMN